MTVLVSWCIPGVVVAQLFQRVTRIPDSFAVIAIFLFGTTITNILLNSLCGDQSSLFGLPGLLTRPFWPSLCPVGQKCAPDNDGASGDDAEDGGRPDVCIFNDWLAFTSGLVLLSLFWWSERACGSSIALRRVAAVSSRTASMPCGACRVRRAS